jgi:uncharacterized Zn-binding protein involved in type VI secretion
MRIPIVCHGDSTTTRGKVVAFSATIHDHGRKIALYGDEATCGNCKGLWKIFGTGKGVGEKGRVAVVNGDHVLCPCGKNRVIANVDAGIFVHRDTGKGGMSSHEAASNASKFIYDEQVRAVSAYALLAGYPYFIEAADGQQFAGRLDPTGRLPRVYTASANSYTVYWGDEALAHEDRT